jgi:GT2 family glycosyltransferase/glycosyltransferase involved in cell wall biosynthesis
VLALVDNQSGPANLANGPWLSAVVAHYTDALEQRAEEAQRSARWRIARRLQRALDGMRRRPDVDALGTLRSALRDLRRAVGTAQELRGRVAELESIAASARAAQTYEVAGVLAPLFGERGDGLAPLRAELARLGTVLETGEVPIEVSRVLRIGGRAALVDVVIPVYGNADETLRCIASVLAAPVETPYELVVIDDASPDAELLTSLEKLESDGRITLLRNPRNLGFTGTANRGLALHGDRDVVLLNSDTEVNGNWLDRLRDAAYGDWRVGTVTPFSNDAEICSYPLICRRNALPPDSALARLDALFARANPGQTFTVPTGVGFCMYTRRACLDEVGLFDLERFGRGYGEENDFCMRARRLGWRNVLAANVFVYHAGGSSFGAEKAARVQKAVQQVAASHPSYLRDVDEWIGADPVFAARRRVDLLRMDDPRPAVLLVSHAIGGGTERHVRELGERLGQSGVRVLLLRPAGGNCVALAALGVAEMPNACFSIPYEYRLLIESLRALDVRHVHVHHWLGLPADLDDLAADLGVECDVTLHDYFTLCPRVHLTDGSGRYCGVPGPDTCNSCVAANGSELGSQLDVGEHRQRYAAVLRAARRVFVPSSDVARRIGAHIPGVVCHVRPHFETWTRVAPVAAERRAGEPLRVAVIGAIGPHKGSEVLQACLRDADERALPIRFVLVGYSDRDRDLLTSPRFEMTGAYEERELFERLREKRCHCAFFASVWPETYCYTLSAAMLGGLTPISFDLGAQGERIAATGGGLLLPIDASAAEINDALLAFAPRESARPAPAQCFERFWEAYYEAPFPLDAPARIGPQR